jgi:hypothetical protein
MTASTARAQSARLGGVVTDVSGGVVADAVVAVVQPSTGTTTATRTTGAGLFLFPELQPAAYRLEVTKPGFRTAIRDAIRLTVATAVQLDVTLEPGDITDRVVVTGAAPLVTTQNHLSLIKDFVPEMGRNFKLLYSVQF